MSSLIQYRPLFRVQLLHEYYLSNDTSLYSGISTDQQEKVTEKQRKNYNVSRDFNISPTKDCVNLLGNLKLIFKHDSFGFFVASKVKRLEDGTFIPFITLNEPFSLRFTVCLINQYLLNFSNLSLQKDVEKKDHFLYYFSNRANNLVTPNVLYLSKPVSGFNTSIEYEAGEVIIRSQRGAQPLMFEAIEDNGPGRFNTSKWLSVFSDLNPLPQFITKEDLIVARPKIFRHKVEFAAKEKLTFTIFDNKGVKKQTQNFETTKPGTPLSECELRLTNLSSALYSLSVQDDTGTSYPELGLRFFLDDSVYFQKPFALFELFHEPDGSLNEYRLLDQEDNNRLLSPDYVVNFKNRSTFWRYYYDTAPSFTSSQVEVYKPNNGNPINNILVTKQPLGLTHFGRRIEISIGRDSILLPNPYFGSIFPEGGRIYSEINMGGGLGPPKPD